MKYCPNRQCWYALRHHEGQEYRDDIAVCADCGVELVAERPVFPRSDPLPHARKVVLRLALTLLAPFVTLWLPSLLPLPRLDHRLLENRPGPFADSARASVFGLGLTPIFSAFVLVELVALATPRLRPLRHGGPEGRARLLTATWQVGLGLAVLQASATALYLEKAGLLEDDRRLSRLIIVLSLVAGTFALVAFAQLLDRLALGGGFSVLLLAFTLPSLVPFAEGMRSHWVTEPLVSTLAVIGLGAAGVLAFVLLQRRLGRAFGKPSALRLPACGLVPLRQSVGFLAFPGILAGMGAWPVALPMPSSLDESGLLLPLALTGGLAVVFGVLFNRPDQVAALESPGATGVAGAAQVEAAREEVMRATAWSSAYLLGLVALGWLLGRAWGIDGLDFVPLVALAAIGLDVVAEARALGLHDELVPVWPEHRLYAVDGALAMLERASIPGLARSVHHRALWHFFAPYMPIQILVPKPRAEEASRLLHAHFRTGRDLAAASPSLAPEPEPAGA